MTPGWLQQEVSSGVGFCPRADDGECPSSQDVRGMRQASRGESWAALGAWRSLLSFTGSQELVSELDPEGRAEVVKRKSRLMSEHCQTPYLGLEELVHGQLSN